MLANERGFTLVEMLISVAIVMILMTAAGRSFLLQGDMFVAQNEVVGAIQDAKSGIKILTKDIQRSGYNPSGAAFSGVSCDSNELTLMRDTNGDGDTNDIGENVTYELDNGALTRNSAVVVRNVQAFVVSYSGGVVTVTITAQTEKPDKNYGINNGHRLYTLESKVRPRNS